MILSVRKLVAGVVAMGGVAAVIVACGSADDSKFKDNGVGNPGFLNDASINGNGEGGVYDPTGELYKDDPPPDWCGPDSGVVGPKIGGTPECPDDKNRPNCGCTTVGEEADCWTGLRKHRKLGVCKDGRTKCIKKTENENVWGPCEGQVLPQPGATGELACSCFSVGLWKIENTVPCIWIDGQGPYAYATKPGAGGCTDADHRERGQVVDGIWSKNTLKTDCAGSFKLVFRIRVGDIDDPKSSDCVLGEAETDVVYTQANVEQSLPDLKPWANSNTECVKKWEIDTPSDVSPGYGEMIVKGGQTVACEAVADVNAGQEFVFNRVQFCPKICRDAANKDHPACKECQERGQGKF